MKDLFSIYNRGSTGKFSYLDGANDIYLDRNKKCYTNKNDEISGLYSPFILRPNEIETVKNEKYEVQNKNAEKYYGMRKIVSPNTYNEWLSELFTYLSNPNDDILKQFISSDMQARNQYYSNDKYTSEEKYITKWLMQKIAAGVEKLDSMHQNGSWGNEQFYDTDVKFYPFRVLGTATESSVYKINFNLYNPLRSTSTFVECIIINPDNSNNYTIFTIDFINPLGLKNYQTDSELDGYNLSTTCSINVGLSPRSNYSPSNWYFNGTVEKIDNVNIQAGVPESFKQKLKSVYRNGTCNN